MACIEYSHGHLDPQAQALLACFAPFTGVLDTALIESYQEALAEEPALAGLPLDRLGEVLEHTRGLSLLQRDAKVKEWLRPHPALSWFLSSRLATVDQLGLRGAIERAFCKLYLEFAGSLFQLQISNNLKERQLATFIVENEYANLNTALCFALDQQTLILPYYRVLLWHFEQLQDHRRRRELAELVLARRERLPHEALRGALGEELVGVIDSLAHLQLVQRDYSSARVSLEKALALHDRVEWPRPREADGGRASILHQLGMVALEQGRIEEAKTFYEEALKIFTSSNDPYAANSYHQLGILAAKQRRLEEAEAFYNKALEVRAAFNDRHNAALTYVQLGEVFQEQSRLNEAAACYEEALEIFTAFGDRYNQAKAHHHLASVAQDQNHFEEAEAARKRSLAIERTSGNDHTAAQTYCQLGTMAQDQGQFQEAESYYEKSIEIFGELGELQDQAISYHYLARAKEAQGKFEEAEAAYRKALDIQRLCGDLRGAAVTHNHIGGLAEEQRRLEDAVTAYKEALEIFITLGDRHEQAARYYRLGTIAEKQSRFKEAEAAYEKELEIELARGDRRRAADTYHQLGKVAQEQSQFTKAEGSYTKALEIFIEVDDRQSAEAVLRSLACLFAATGALNIPSIIAAVLKVDVGEAYTLMEALRRESADSD